MNECLKPMDAVQVFIIGRFVYTLSWEQWRKRREGEGEGEEGRGGVGGS